MVMLFYTYRGGEIEIYSFRGVNLLLLSTVKQFISKCYILIQNQNLVASQLLAMNPHRCLNTFI